MLITPAFAQSSGGLAEGGFGLLPIIFVMVIFYFLLIRPQQKRAKQHKEMLAAIRRGDKIVTSGGLTGTVVKVVDDSDTVEVEIAKDVKVHVVRAIARTTCTLTSFAISTSTVSLSSTTLTTVPVKPPDVTILSPRLMAASISLCCLARFCCGRISRK